MINKKTLYLMALFSKLYGMQSVRSLSSHSIRTIHSSNSIDTQRPQNNIAMTEPVQLTNVNFMQIIQQQNAMISMMQQQFTELNKTVNSLNNTVNNLTNTISMLQKKQEKFEKQEQNRLKQEKQDRQNRLKQEEQDRQDRLDRLTQEEQDRLDRLTQEEQYRQERLKQEEQYRLDKLKQEEQDRQDRLDRLKQEEQDRQDRLKQEEYNKILKEKNEKIKQEELNLQFEKIRSMGKIKIIEINSIIMDLMESREKIIKLFNSTSVKEKINEFLATLGIYGSIILALSPARFAMAIITLLASLGMHFFGPNIKKEHLKSFKDSQLFIDEAKTQKQKLQNLLDISIISEKDELIEEIQNTEREITKLESINSLLLDIIKDLEGNDKK